MDVIIEELNEMEPLYENKALSEKDWREVPGLIDQLELYHKRSPLVTLWRNRHYEHQRALLFENKSAGKTEFQAVTTSRNGLEQLKQARTQLQETVTIAEDTLMNLQKQEEQMNKIQGGLKGVETELDASSGLLRRMMRWWRS